jgi:hypothetical protein
MLEMMLSLKNWLEVVMTSMEHNWNGMLALRAEQRYYCSSIVYGVWYYSNKDI